VQVQNRGPAGHFNGWTLLWKVRTNAKGAFATTHKMKCGSTHNIAIYIASDRADLSNRSRTIFGIKSFRNASGFPTSR
jgi:hypothetical protein